LQPCKEFLHKTDKKTHIQKVLTVGLSVHKAVLLQNNISSHNNSLNPADMRQHYLRGLPFLVSKKYYFEVRCSFIAIRFFYAEAGKRSKNSPDLTIRAAFIVSIN